MGSLVTFQELEIFCSALKFPVISVIIPILLEFSALAYMVEHNKIVKKQI